MYLENYQVNKFVLLSGAGFTRDFGGFLANEMWALIFNQPELNRYPRVKSLMQNDFDYESIYYKVAEGNEFNEDERKTLTAAIFSAYKKLDDKIKDYQPPGTSQPVSINEVNKFIAMFAWNRSQKGFFFTLNQDQFIERYFSSSDYSIVTLGVPKHLITDITDYNDIRLPDSIESMVNKISDAQFFYVKLHGSYKWKSSDGRDRMVIGKNKKTRWKKNLF